MIASSKIGVKILEQVIFHVDVNSAFLSWEAVHRLSEPGETRDLREAICAVGGDSSMRHGVILAKSIKAKQFGVQTGESIMEARKKCPDLEIVAANHELYKKMSEAFIELLREYSPHVEQYSIDEAFVDMTGMEALFGTPKQAADRIRERIYKELGFTVNIGVSNNKLLAKMASDFKKPNLVHTLFPEEIEKKMWPLPVGELFFVGDATEKKLKEMGITTIGDLAGTDQKFITSHLKKHGELIWNFANGRGLDVVETEPPDHKGYGNSTTIAFDVTDADTARMVLLSLADTVAARLRSHHVKAEVISVTIKNYRLETASHQMVLRTPTNITAEIHQAACRLFEELWDGTPIRLLGIQTTRMKEEGARQMSIFDDTDYEKLEKMDKAVDSIREKFGADSVKRASFLVPHPTDYKQ
ncbi:MAG: DNA polymerase IV [Clostridium sp.]